MTYKQEVHCTRATRVHRTRGPLTKSKLSTRVHTYTQTQHTPRTRIQQRSRTSRLQSPNVQQLSTSGSDFMRANSYGRSVSSLTVFCASLRCSYNLFRFQVTEFFAFYFAALFDLLSDKIFRETVVNVSMLSIIILQVNWKRNFCYSLYKLRIVQ